MPANTFSDADLKSWLTSCDRGRAFQFEYTVRQAGVQDGNAHGVAVQLALELRIDQRDGGGASGRRRLHRQHRRSCAAEILVRGIDDDVGIGRIVDRRDLPVTDSNRFVDDLDDRRQTVRRAGCRRQQPMPGGIVEVVVDADHDVERRLILDGRRNDHAFDAAVEIGLKLIRLQEFSGAFQHDVAAEIAPGDVAGRSVFAEANALLAEGNGAVGLHPDGFVPASVDAIEFEKMGRSRDAAFEFVDVDDIQTVVRARIALRTPNAAECRAQHEPADTAHAIDANFHMGSS